MSWLWIVGPLLVALIYVVTGLIPDRRRAAEVERWKAAFGVEPIAVNPAGSRGGKKAAKNEPPPGPREVRSMPGELMRMVDAAGGGSARGYYELFPRLAYLAVMDADPTCSSDHQTVVARLAKPGPSFTARPLPILEGNRVPNTGIQFKKDPGFMELFLVEGTQAADIGKWLRKSIRDILCEHPEVWLRVQGRVMALSLYGRADAEQIDDLVEAADAIFAEVGAEGGPSLLGTLNDDEDDEEDEDDEDDDEGDEDDEAEDSDEGDEDEDDDDDDDEDADRAANTPEVKAKVEPKSAPQQAKSKAPSAQTPKPAEKQPAATASTKKAPTKPSAKASPAPSKQAKAPASPAKVSAAKPSGAPSKTSPQRKG